VLSGEEPARLAGVAGWIWMIDKSDATRTVTLPGES
jgi:hypothetical protein